MSIPLAKFSSTFHPLENGYSDKCVLLWLTDRTKDLKNRKRHSTKATPFSKTILFIQYHLGAMYLSAVPLFPEIHSSGQGLLTQ